MINNGGIQVITGRGTAVSAEAMHAVDHLLEMEKKLPKWEFIAMIVKVWAKRRPDLWASYTNRSKNEQYRGELLNDHGATRDLGMRRVIDVPVDLWDTIGFFYPEEYNTLPFQKSFANEFPMFRVSEGKI